MERISGLIAATHTPMREDGTLWLDPLEKLAERFARDGLSGVFPCGSTGEFASLRLEERLRVVQRWVEVAGPELKVIAHVGGTCLPECKELAIAARKAGVDAFSAIAPYYFRPQTVDELVHFCAELASAAPDLPFYYYHLPLLSGVDFPMPEFLEKGAARIPNLAGIKFSHLNLVDLGRCAAMHDGHFDMLFGCDESLLSALVLGARGAVGTTYCFAAPLYQRLQKSFSIGDLASARRDQVRSMEMVTVFFRHGGHAAMKAVMKEVGLDVGPPRLPLRVLSSEAYEALLLDLEAVGFKDFCSRP